MYSRSILCVRNQVRLIDVGYTKEFHVHQIRFLVKQFIEEGPHIFYGSLVTDAVKPLRRNIFVGVLTANHTVKCSVISHKCSIINIYSFLSLSNRMVLSNSNISRNIRINVGNPKSSQICLMPKSGLTYANKK